MTATTHDATVVIDAWGFDMARYFQGRREIAHFSQLVAGERARIDCRVYEEWEDIDRGTIARCGNEATCTIEKSFGLDEKALYSLKGIIESTLGMADVLNIKSQLEAAIGCEINWHSSEKITKTFSFSAPKCGLYALTIYQLVRIYELAFFRKRWMKWRGEEWERKWLRTLREKTNNHDAWPDVEEFLDHCNCLDVPLEKPSFDGQLSIDFGRISMRAPYYLTDTGFEVQILDKILAYNFTEYASVMRGLDNGLDTDLPANLLPEPLLFLGDVTASQLTGRMQKLPSEGWPLQSVATDHLTLAIDAPVIFASPPSESGPSEG